MIRFHVGFRSSYSIGNIEINLNVIMHYHLYNMPIFRSVLNVDNINLIFLRIPLDIELHDLYQLTVMIKQNMGFGYSNLILYHIYVCL